MPLGKQRPPRGQTRTPTHLGAPQDQEVPALRSIPCAEAAAPAVVASSFPDKQSPRRALLGFANILVFSRVFRCTPAPAPARAAHRHPKTTPRSGPFRWDRVVQQNQLRALLHNYLIIKI